MLTPETCTTLYPFSTAFWQPHTNPHLPYRTMVFTPPSVLPQSSAKRYFPRRNYRNGASSFTINAILGLQDAETRHADRAVCEFAIQHRQFASSVGAKLPGSRRPPPAAHPGLLPASTYLASPLDVGRNIRTFDSNEEAKSRHSGEKRKDFDFEFWENLEASGADRKIFDRDDIGTGVEDSATPLGWLGNLPEQTSKPKRVRTIFTQDQLERLEKEFARQQYMVGTERLYLAAQLDLSESQVKVWFQNRRIKWRKQHLESQQERLAQYRALREKERLDSKAKASQEKTDTPTGAGRKNDVMNVDSGDDVNDGSQADQNEAGETQVETHPEEEAVLSVSSSSSRDTATPLAGATGLK